MIDHSSSGPLPIRGVAMRALMLAVLACLFSACSYPPWYTVNLPNKQDPSLVFVTGPSVASPDTYTFRVRVTYDNPISTAQGFVVRLDVFEDDYGDVLLDRNVVLSFPAGASSATKSFRLSCVDDGNGNLSIVGQDGQNTHDDVWEVFAVVREQSTSEHEEGPNHEFRCEIP